MDALDKLIKLTQLRNLREGRQARAAMEGDVIPSRPRTEAYRQRPLSKYERRVDFAAIKRIFDEDALAVDLTLRGFVKEARDSLLALIERQNILGLTADFALSLRIDVGKEFARAAEQYLMDVWRKNRDLALAELPEKIRQGLNYLRRYEFREYASAFKADIAGDYFRNRALMIKGLVDDQLTQQTKFQIFEHLKGGRTINETMGNLRELFEPWVGDPTKIAPSGITGTAEDILQAYRLENIVRTETVTAMSQGRATVADAAEEYVLGYEHSSILDLRTSTVCQLADGIMFRKDDLRAIRLQPPLHWQCRSVDVFITADDVPVEWSSEALLDRVVREIPKEFK